MVVDNPSKYFEDFLNNIFEAIVSLEGLLKIITNSKIRKANV
jgi:hypothetical protein